MGASRLYKKSHNVYILCIKRILSKVYISLGAEGLLTYRILTCKKYNPKSRATVVVDIDTWEFQRHG